MLQIFDALCEAFYDAAAAVYYVYEYFDFG